MTAPVALFDVETNTVFGRMTHRNAEIDLAAARDLGDTLQEYDTTDRTGRPLRVVLHVNAEPVTRYADDGRAYQVADQGGVYEIPLAG
ncbi:hypothetical protein ACWGCW_00665 [Streptomyces sp. NPDC054933]